MKTLHLSIIVGVAISIMVTVPYVILTTPHSTGPIGAVTPDLNAMKSVSTIIIPKDSEDQSSGKNYQPDRFVVILGVNNTVRWINEADVGNTVVADNYDDPGFANATKSESEGYTHLKLTNFLNPGKSFTYTFTKIGYFGFHGEPHPWLHGMVLVLPEHPVNLTQTVSLNDSQALGPCVIFALSCPRGPHIFTAQKFGSDIYIEKLTINGADHYAVVNPEDYCVYPNGYSKSCTNPVDLALLRLAGVDTQVPQEDINISIKGLASSYPVGKPIDFGIEINGYGHCESPSVLLIHDGVIVWQSKTAWVSCAYTNSQIDEKYTIRDFGGPFYLNQSGTYTVHVGYRSNSTEARFHVISYMENQTGGYTKYADAYGLSENDCGQFYMVPEDNHIFEVYPVLILQQNSTGCAKLTFTINYKYDDNRNGAVWPEMVRFGDTLRIGKYSYTTTGYSFGVSSIDTTSTFKIKSIPDVVDLAKYPVGSQFTVTLVIQPLPNATGFYDYSIEEVPCDAYPLAVGYSQDQVNSSDFSKGMVLMHNHSCFNAPYVISAVRVSGMDFKQIKFQ